MFDESSEQSWLARYGQLRGIPDEIFSPLLRHRSVRNFSDREVSEALVGNLVACGQSASTSSNLQLWSVISVQDPAKRAVITALCDNQVHVQTAPWFLAFVTDCNRVKQAAATASEEAKGLDYAEFYTMAIIDTALAAERFVAAAEMIGLGACYIGALRNDVAGVARALELPPLTFGAFGLCLGWPAEGSRAAIKPRLAQDSVWFREKYPAAVDVADYDLRMKDFYKSQGMNEAVTWSMRSGKRVDEHHLTGREALKPWLEAQGFFRR